MNISTVSTVNKASQQDKITEETCGLLQIKEYMQSTDYFKKCGNYQGEVM